MSRSKSPGIVQEAVPAGMRRLGTVELQELRSAPNTRHMRGRGRQRGDRSKGPRQPGQLGSL